MAEGIKIGEVFADLKLDSGNLERGISRAKTALQGIARDIVQLDESYKRGEIGLRDYTRQLQALTETQKQLHGGIVRARSEIDAFGHLGGVSGPIATIPAAMDKASGSTKNFGFALMQLGSIVDDAQYGFQGVVNNIGPLVMGLSGGNMGMAAAAQIAAVAVAQLVRHWDDLKSAMGTNDHIKTAADEMKRLGDETQRTADQEERYQRLKRGEKTGEELKGKRSEWQDKSERETKQAIANMAAGGQSGYSVVTAGVMAHGAGDVVDPEYERELKAAAAERDMGGPIGAMMWNQLALTPAERDAEAERHYQERVRKAKQAHQARREAEAQRLVNSATSNPADRQALITMVENDIKQNNGANFGGETRAREFLLSLKENSPERIRQADEDKKAAEHRRKDVTDVAKGEKAAGVKEEKRLTEEREFEEAAQQYKDQQAAPYVKGYKKGKFGNMLLTGGNVTEAMIHDDMIAHGATENEANALAGTIAKALKEEIDHEIHQYAGEHNVSHEQAGWRISTDRLAKKALANEQAANKVRDAKERVADMAEQIRRNRREHQAPAMEDTASYAKKMAVAGLKRDNYQQDMLKMQRELKEATENVEKAIKEQDIRARATE